MTMKLFLSFLFFLFSPFTSSAKGDCLPSVSLGLWLDNNYLAQKYPLNNYDPASLFIYGEVGKAASVASDNPVPEDDLGQMTPYAMSGVGRALLILHGVSLCLDEQLPPSLTESAVRLSHYGFTELAPHTLAFDYSGQRAARLIAVGPKLLVWEQEAQRAIDRQEAEALGSILNEIERFLAERSVDEPGESTNLTGLYYGEEDPPPYPDSSSPILRAPYGVLPIRILHARLVGELALLKTRPDLIGQALASFNDISAELQAYTRPTSEYSEFTSPRPPNPRHLDFLANFYRARLALDWLSAAHAEQTEIQEEVFRGIVLDSTHCLDVHIDYEDAPLFWALIQSVRAEFFQYAALEMHGSDDLHLRGPLPCAARAHADLASGVLEHLRLQSQIENWCSEDF